MSAKHTAGPWRVVTNAPGAAEPAVMAGDYFIATVHGLGNGNTPETLANARLIAAAPELLDALREAERLYASSALLPQAGYGTTPGNRFPTGRWINTVRDLLARIDGQEAK